MDEDLIQQEPQIEVVPPHIVLKDGRLAGSVIPMIGFAQGAAETENGLFYTLYSPEGVQLQVGCTVPAEYVIPNDYDESVKAYYNLTH